MIRLTAPDVAIDAAGPDGQARRTISGVAVPYGVPATVSDGTSVIFLEGSLPTTGKAPKLFMYHDSSQPIGVVTDRVETSEGMMFSAKLSKVAAADEALILAQDGVLDSVSVGVNPTKFSYDDQGNMLVEKASWMELSMVPIPAFAGAIITDVLASIHQEPESADNNEADNSTEETDTMSETVITTEVQAEGPAVITPNVIHATARKEFKLPSAAEWISAQLIGGSYAAEFNANIRAAAPDVTTTDLDGILPLPIVAPIYNSLRGLRPVIDAIGARAMPQGGKVFIIPKVTTNTSIAAGQTQNSTITAGQYVVDDIQVTKDIFGGYVEVSEASIDWTSPEVLTGLLDDMARVYAVATDNAAADALLSGTSQATGNVAPTDPKDWVAKVYACANTILSEGGGWMPDHLFVSGDVFAQLGTLSDDSDRPLFPQVGPMNAFGSMTPGSRDAVVFGLKLVVDTNFAAKTCIVGNASTGAFRWFEMQKGALSLDQPSSLSRVIAFRGYGAAKMIDAKQFMKIPQA